MLETRRKSSSDSVLSSCCFSSPLGGSLGALLGALGGPLGAPRGHKEGSFGPAGASFGPIWARSGCSSPDLARFEPFGGPLGPPKGPQRGPTWGGSGALSAHVRSNFVHTSVPPEQQHRNKLTMKKKIMFSEHLGNFWPYKLRHSGSRPLKASAECAKRKQYVNTDYVPSAGGKKGVLRE